MNAEKADHSASNEIPAEIAVNTPLPDSPGDAKVFTVGYLGPKDPLDPHNMSTARKIVLLLSLAYVIMVAAWGSAIGAAAIPVFMGVYHIGLPVSALTVSLYVVGFAVGPIIWGPVSSMYGRKIPLFVGSFIMMLFFFACATAENFQTVVISRFFQGAFGAAQLTVGPAIAGDVFSSKGRGYAMSLVAFCVVAGPLVAPLVGGYITQSYLGWRWTQYITGIMAALACVIIVFIFPETYTPTVLKTKAQELREKTGNWAIQAPGEYEHRRIDFKELLVSPMVMLVQEPILGLISIYHGLIYGILYMCLEAVPIIFEGYNFPGANVYLAYMPILIGAVIVCLLNAAVLDPWTNRQLDLHKKAVMPENRLVLMMISSVAFVIGIFWLCWTGAYAKHIHWIVPMIGGSFVGFGMIGIFVACFNYILDTYLQRSAMAFAANTFLRSAFGCAFPLFVHPMFVNLGTQWAGTLVGCLALVMVPVPFLFYFYGAKLRSMSRHAINLDDFIAPVPVTEGDKKAEA